MKTLLLLLAGCGLALAQNPVLRDYSCTAASAAGTDTYACNAATAPASYAAIQGKTVCFVADVGNTGAATLNLSSLGAKAIKIIAGGVTTDPATNDIRANEIVCMRYDGTNFQLQSPSGNAAAGASVINSAVGDGGWFPFGTINYAPSGVSPALTNAGRGMRFLITVQAPMTYRSLNVYQYLGCASTCGLQAAIYNIAMTTQVAVTVSGSRGGTPDLTAAGAKVLTFASGTMVTSNVLTIQPGTYWVVLGTDVATATMTLAHYGDTVIAQTLNGTRQGYSGAAIVSGTGSSTVLTADLSGATWTQTGQTLIFEFIN